MRARVRASAGFTVIEVVLAMFLLLVGMTSILGLLSFGAALTRTAALRTEAAAAIEVVVADLEEFLFPVVLVEGEEAVGAPRVIEGRAVPGHPELVYSARTEPLPGEPSNPPLEYRVDVELTWGAGRGQRTHAFSTLLLREVPFGARLRQRFVEGLEPATPLDEDAR